MFCRSGHYSCLELQILSFDADIPDIEIVPVYAPMIRNLVDAMVPH